jgi:hypothetical protein
MNEVERVKRGDFSDELFSSLKMELERSYKLKLEDIDSRSQEMLTVFSQGKSWKDYLNEIKQIESLTKDDVVAVANRYFNENYLAMTKKQAIIQRIISKNLVLPLLFQKMVRQNQSTQKNSH